MCPTVCDPMDCGPPAFSVHGISQARIVGWITISFSKGSSHPGIKPLSPVLAGGFFASEPPGKPKSNYTPKKKHRMMCLQASYPRSIQDVGERGKDVLSESLLSSLYCLLLKKNTIFLQRASSSNAAGTFFFFFFFTLIMLSFLLWKNVCNAFFLFTQEKVENISIS